jgi:hypothetical protein
MQDEYNSSTSHSAGGDQKHRRTPRHNDRMPIPASGCAIGSLQTCVACERIKSFRTRVHVDRRRHPGIENALHVYGRVLEIRRHWQRTNFRDSHAGSRVPVGLCNREQPDLSEQRCGCYTETTHKSERTPTGPNHNGRT